MGDSGSSEQISETEGRDRGRIRMCRICKYTTTNSKEFSHHQLNAHKEIVTSQYECEDCNFLTLSNIEFARHRKSHLRNSRNSVPSKVDREMQRPTPDSKMPPTCEDDVMMEEEDADSKMEENFEDDALVIDEHAAEPSHATSGATSGNESRTYSCQNKNHQAQEHAEFELYENEICEFVTKDKDVLATHVCGKENEKEDEETQERPGSEVGAYEEEDDEAVPSPESSETPIGEFGNASDNTQDSGPFVTPSRVPLSGDQGQNEHHYPESKYLEMVKPRSRIIRQEVDPAKYTQINTLEGIRYSCSNCGNVYKWRKSLNKHWKEKHFGETPTSTVPLKVPQFIPSGLVSAVGPLQRPRKSPISFAPRLPSQPLSARSTPTDIYRQVTTPELPLPVQGGHRDSPFSPNHFPGIYGFSLPPAASQDEALDLTKKSEPPIQARPRMSPPELVIPKPTHLLNDVQRSVFAIPQEEPIDFSSKPSVKREPQSDVGYDLSLKVDTDLGDVSSEFGTPLSDNLKCPKCPYVAQFRYDYDRHIELHMRKRTQTCVECQKSFVTIEELNSHFAEAHKDVINDERRNMSYKLHPADSCFPMDALPLQDGKTLKCTKCDYMARWPTELQKHAITHSTDRPFVCMVCGSSYKWKWDLVKHFDKSHTMLTNPYKKRDTSPGDPPSLMTPPGQLDEHRDGDVIILDEQPELKRPRLNIPEYTPVHSDVSPKYLDTPLLEGSAFNRPFKCDLCPFSSNYKGGLAVHRRHYHHILTPNLDSGSPSPASSTMTTPSPTLTIPQFSGIDTLANQVKQLPSTPSQVSKTAYNKMSAPGGSGGRSKQGRQTGPGASAEMLLPYKCTVCEYRARWPSEITQHMKNHSDEKPYHCPRCTYKSKWKWDVVKHLKRCGGGTIKDVIDTTKQKDRTRQKFAPPNVTVMTSGTSNTAAPAQPAYIYSPITLAQNFKVVPAPPQQQHSTPQTGNTAATGPQETSPSISDPKFNNMVNQGQYICLQCPFIGNSPAELKRHSVLHSDSKPYVCKSCGYGSKWKCDLKKHLRTYNHEALDPELAAAMAISQTALDDKPEEPLPEMEKPKGENALSAPVFPTPMLVQGTSQPMLLPIQLPDQDMEEEKSSLVYNCLQCKYTTTKKHMLEAHQRIHTQPGKKPNNKLTCKQCDFEAEDLPTFLQHKLTHSAQQPEDGTDLSSEIQGDRKHRRKPVKQFRCHKCPYVCFKKSGLEQHESMHEPRGTDTFKCDYCDYNVYSRNLLTQHMRLHPEFTQQYENEDSEEDYQLEYNMEPKVGSSKQRIFPKSKDSRYDHEGATVDLSRSGDDGENIPPVLQAVGLTTPAGAAIMESQKSPRKLSPTEQIFSPMMTYSMQGSPMKTNGSPVAHKCPKCPYVTGHKINFEKHIRMHTVRSKFVCEWCDWSADRLNLLWRHVKLIHPEQLDTFQQDKDEIYGLKRKPGRMSPGFSQHNGSPKVDGDLSESSTQGMDLTSDTSVKGLSNNSVGRKKYFCNKCGYVTDNSYNLQRHLDQHNKPGRHICDRCDYSVDRLNLLYQHIRGVHGDQLYGTDPILDEEMRSDEDTDGMTLEKLNEKVIPVGHKLFKCRDCDFTTQNINICNSHALRHGSNSRFTCDFCDYSMENMSGVYQHMVAVHLQSLREQENLERLPEETEIEHPQAHQQGGLINEYREGHIMKCPDCPFKSLVPESMERHREKHGYKGKYTCEYCNYSLDRVNLLYHHMHLHEKSNSKLMNSNSMVPMNLNRSLYMELEPKPKRPRTSESGGTSSRVKIRYKCTRCPYATFCKQNIFKHKKQHLIKSKYRCELCTYSATRWFLLQQHMKFHDTEDDPTAQRSVFQDIFLDPEEDDSVVEIERSKVPSSSYKQDADKVEALARLKSSAAAMKKVKDIKCRLCGFETNSDVEFSTHVECHEAGQRYRCDYCDFISNHLNTIHAHRHQHCQEASFIENPPLENILNRNFHEIEYFKVEETSTGVNMNTNYESPKVNYESPNPSPMSAKSDENSKSASMKSDQSDYECAFCGFVFLTEGEHMNHTQQHGANKKYVCDFCDWSSDVLEDVYAHRNLVHIRSSNFDPQPNEDELKNKDGSSCSENDSADNTDVNSKLFRCDQCPFECSSKSALGGHLRFHVNSGRHKCDKCSFSIDKLNLLYQHMKLHFSGSTFANHYQCRKCPFITKNRDILQFHVGCHGSNSQFKCNFCDYAVERLASLEQHNKLHSSKFGVSDGELPVHSLKHYKEVREKQMLNLNLMAPENGHDTPNVNHEKPNVNNDKYMHNGSENEAEDVSDNDGYEAHDTDDPVTPSGMKLTPVRGKPLKQHLCSKCPYKTTNKSNFISHLAQHRAQSKFTCPYCDYSSARMDQIGMHMRLHFPEAELDAKSIELLLANNDSPADLTLKGCVDEENNITDSEVSDLKCKAYNKTTTCQHCNQNFDNMEAHECQRHIISY